MENITSHEIFRQKQAEIPDKKLIELCTVELSKLCRTGGKSLTMCVPPMITDTDMLFAELIYRFKNKQIK